MEYLTFIGGLFLGIVLMLFALSLAGGNKGKKELYESELD